MNVIGASVNEHIGFANPPTLEIYIDGFAGSEDFRYQEKKIGSRTLYFAELNGEVRFFAHDPQNEYGYGGRIFHIHMEDGTVRNIPGPWSSRAGVMSAHFRPVVDVTLIAGTRLAGHCTLEIAQEAVDKFLPDWALIEVDDGEKYWRPKHKEYI